MTDEPSVLADAHMRIVPTEAPLLPSEQDVPARTLLPGEDTGLRKRGARVVREGRASTGDAAGHRA
jgi:hypothetical protein